MAVVQVAVVQLMVLVEDLVVVVKVEVMQLKMDQLQDCKILDLVVVENQIQDFILAVTVAQVWPQIFQEQELHMLEGWTSVHLNCALGWGYKNWKTSRPVGVVWSRGFILGHIDYIGCRELWIVHRRYANAVYGRTLLTISYSWHALRDEFFCLRKRISLYD